LLGVVKGGLRKRRTTGDLNDSEAQIHEKRGCSV